LTPSSIEDLESNRLDRSVDLSIDPSSLTRGRAREADPSEVWEAALEELESQVTRPNFDTWLKHTSGLAYADGEFVVGTPNAFVAEMLEQRMYSLIAQTVESVVEAEVEVRFAVEFAWRTDGAVLPRLDASDEPSHDAGGELEAPAFISLLQSLADPAEPAASWAPLAAGVNDWEEAHGAPVDPSWYDYVAYRIDRSSRLHSVVGFIFSIWRDELSRRHDLAEPYEAPEARRRLAGRY